MMDREDWLMIGIVVFFTLAFWGVIIFICGIEIEKQKEKCEENGGFALEVHYGYQCITKEDIRKIIGE